MGKKHDHIMLELARLGMRVEVLERAVDSLRPVDSQTPPTVFGMPIKDVGATSQAEWFNNVHKCRFMPPGFLIKLEIEDCDWPPKPDVWRLYPGGGSEIKPRINFCPYCGVELCEPETP